MNIDVFKYDFRRFDTEHAISSLRRYLQLMDAKMEEAHRQERGILEAECTRGRDEEAFRMWQQEVQALDDMFEQQLRPAMLYSFVSLIHTVFETRLRAFCRDIQKQLGTAISSPDFRGGPIEQARIFLSKVASFPVNNSPEWTQLISFQKVRNCIVHANGYIAEVQDETLLRDIVSKNIGVGIDDWGRLVISTAFCDLYLACLERLFCGLFDAAGWADGKSPK